MNVQLYLNTSSCVNTPMGAGHRMQEHKAGSKSRFGSGIYGCFYPTNQSQRVETALTSLLVVRWPKRKPFGHVVMHSGPTHAVWHSSKSYSSKHRILFVKNKLNTVRTNTSNMTQKPQIKHGSRPDGSRKKKPPVNMHYEHGRQTNLFRGEHTVYALCERL